MDIANVRQINPTLWEIKTGEKGISSALIYGDRALIEAMDEKVSEQLTNVARLPGLVGAAMAMPDAHWGYGFPIGGVAAFDAKAGGIISAGGVGFDISCGIRCLRTNLFLDDLLPHAEELAEVLYHAIPAGLGVEGRLKLSPNQLTPVLEEGARWAVNAGFGEKADLAYIEEQGTIANPVPENVSDLAKKRQHGEMGTLGSGNHYLEVQAVKKIYDKEAAEAFGITENKIIVSIHCGSRGLGHQIGTDYLVKLAKIAKEFGIVLPDRELACAPINSPIGQQYLGAMRAGINCALANRQIITHLTREAFSQVIPRAAIETLYDVSHNTCKVETHDVNGKQKELYIHRKGATRALPPHHPAIPERYRSVGQPVVIGGSMGTGSYILAGNPVEQNNAWSSASHGAGRQMSRRQALKKWRGKELISELEKCHILIRSTSMRGIAEEAPGAYKDVDVVAKATEEGGLARRVAFLVPVVCVKG